MATTEAENNQYVVLARKYRPQTFEDLLGQDALVQTLTNAIKNNRLHHAYILTGIRGVGKTTTARLIARALNCTGLDGKSGPNIHPCGVCENCKAIAAGRHIDVMELDAASRNGVDDMRELLDGVCYKPTNARYKVYIIDEVHMLSKGAFNALLKTLEEPPAHVKFIFATTEIRKVPVTILSRCQRFDLQRLSIETLLTLFHKVLGAEQIDADEEALTILARAADGSARDGLSLLDQAIVLGNGKIKTDSVIEMIGLADRTQTLELFEKLLDGDLSAVLENLHLQYQNGANPLSILQDLIHITHTCTKAKIVPSSINTESMSEIESKLCQKILPSISIAVLSRMWQMMIKGLNELNSAPLPLDALEMILIRIAYSANLPTPAEILNDVKKNSSENINISIKGETQPVIIKPVQPAKIMQFPALSSEPKQEQSIVKNSENVFVSAEDVVKYLEDKKELILAYAFKNDVSIETFDNGYIKMSLSDKASPDLLQNLQNILEKATGHKWQLDISHATFGETLADKENAMLEKNKRDASEHPLVSTILSEFKGAKIDTITRKCLPEEESSADSTEEENTENLTNTYDEEE